MDKNTPAKMIMKTGEWSDADAYRVACDCHSSDHDLDVWIEVETDKEVDEITLTLYKEMYTPVWESGFNRFREAFRILFTGSSRMAGTIILKRDVAQNFLEAVQASIDRLDQKK
jgi:L-fucose mutarotase/ribose pyranase (RbsD/FucU family)